MSFNTDRNWMYSLSGRHIHLWQWTETGATDTVGSYRVKLPTEHYGKQLIYPNEDITNGLRVEYTAFSETFVSEALEDTSARVSGTDISFSTTVLTGAGTNDGFAIGDRVRIIGSASNDGADENVDESSHINLNRMLSLAAIDYIRAQMKEATGDLQGKEYCMREFWKKVGDNESNKRNISISFPASPFAIK